LAPSLIIGCAFKGLAFLYEETRVNDSIIRANMHMVTDLPAKIIANKEKYAALGIDVNPQQTVTVHPNPVVKPSLNDPLLPKEVKKILESQKIDNAAFKIIVDVLMKAGVLWWVDYGTALGVYRHEGVIPWDKDIDLSILAPDHNVVKNLLKEHLDPKKFDVWDFSPNSKPNSMLKIRIKETNMLIDVYHYIIEDAPTEQSKLDEVPLPSAPKKQITYEFSHIHEWYIPEEALKREVRRSYEPEVIFPLKKAKFDGVEVFVPNKLEDYLLANYSRSEASKKKTKEERLKELEPCRIWDETTKKYEKVPDHPYFKESAFNY
jgi:hypothetical protein